MSGHMDFDQDHFPSTKLEAAIEQKHRDLQNLEMGICVAETDEVYKDLIAKEKKDKKALALLLEEQSKLPST